MLGGSISPAPAAEPWNHVIMDSTRNRADALSIIASFIDNLDYDLILLCHYSPDMTHEFPPVEGGGSLILAWQIRNKRVLVVGGGEVLSLKFPKQVWN